VELDDYLNRRGLGHWWRSAFDDVGRRPITERWQSLGSAAESLGTAAAALSAVAGTLADAPETRRIARTLLRKAEELSLSAGDLEGAHVACDAQIQLAYIDRERDPTALSDAVASCERQIAMAPRVAARMQQAYPGAPLPRHIGFEQLRAIRARQGDRDGALRLCREARAQGWGGLWETWIGRYEQGR
jgi:hypothetical protein